MASKPQGSLKTDWIPVCEGIEAMRDGNNVILRLDVSGEPGISGTGKSDVYSSTYGNQQVKGVGIEGLKLGLNLYAPHKDKARK